MEFEMLRPRYLPNRTRFVLQLALVLFVLIGLGSQTHPVQAGPDSSGVEAPAVASATPAIQIFQETEEPEPEWHVTFGSIFWTIVLFFTALFLIRRLTRTLERMAESSTTLRLAIKRVIPMIHILGWSVAVYLIIANAFRLPIQTLIALSASAGIAIGFASQDILKNIFGGIIIVLDRPFQVGDKVEVGSYYGEVLQIGLRSIRIVTPDDSTVSIPNGEIMNQSISNSNSGESNAQVVSEFFLPPDIKLIQAKKIAYRAAAVSRFVFLNKPITVIIKNEVHQGRSIIRMRLKAYVLDIRYEYLFASEMTEIVLQEFLRTKLITAEQLTLFKAS
jgi:small-conductance mechanosensitive channel